MSSLRLALKQSLQESGGGILSSGHGDKKKRRKKKPDNRRSNRGKMDVKRKRGRSHQPDSDEEDVRSDASKDPRRNEDDENGDDFSGNEFSYSEEEEVSDDDDEEEESEDDVRRRRKRNEKRNSGDEDDMEDEPMHSEEDDDDEEDSTFKSHPKNPPQQSKSSNGTAEKEIGIHPSSLDAGEGPSNRASSGEPTSATATAGAENDEIRKKLKLLKLKKKLEQNQNSAANKIQNQWKKQRKNEKNLLDGSIHTDQSEGVSDKAVPNQTDSSNGTSSNKNKGEGEAASSTSTRTENSTQMEISIDPPKLKVGGDENEGNKADRTNTKLSETSSNHNAAGDGGTSNRPVNEGDGEDNKGEESQPEGSAEKAYAKKKKKKNKYKKNNDNEDNDDASDNVGVVPAPARDVVVWGKNISVKKARKAIQVGMRVKVRFATNETKVKKDGRRVTKKIYYGGRITAKSTQGSKIKIKYDDGTSEVSKFPDNDVVIDAVGNGEHAVPADDFVPLRPKPQVEMEVPVKTTNAEHAETKVSDTAPMVTEEGELKSDTAMSGPEDGEVKEEEIKPKPPTAPVASTGSIPQIPKPTSESIMENPIPTVETPATPPPELSKQNESDLAPAPSPEEGELSPGITVSKSTENDCLQKPSPSKEEDAPSKPFSIPEATPVLSEMTSQHVIKPLESNSTTSISTKQEEKLASQPEKLATEPASPPKPKPTKKLSIRIPSNSLATLKGLSSPKAETAHASGSMVGTDPKTTTTPVTATATINDVLIDTPEITKPHESTSAPTTNAKRKRLQEESIVVTLPPLETTSKSSSEDQKELEPPSKQRRIIKVSIGNSANELKSNVDVVTEATKASASSEARAPVVGDKALQEQNQPSFEAMELAPPAKSGAETKKKKRKGDRAKSPRPKSPIPKTTQGATEQTEPTALGCVSTIDSSEKKNVSMESVLVPKASVTKPIGDPVPTAANRSGRKAAEEAKEKMSAKQKAKLTAKESREKEIATGAISAETASSKKKKKRRRQEEAEDQVAVAAAAAAELEAIEENETEWVQCDSCKKWRVLPDNVKVSSLPELWYCHMNIYDKKRSKCEAPEQNIKEALRDRKKRLRKRARREAELADSQHTKKGKQQSSQQLSEELPTTKKKNKQERLHAEKQTPRSQSPKPGKTAKSTKDGDSKKSSAEAKRAANKGDTGTNPTDSGSDTAGKDTKKKGKKGKKDADNAGENHLDAETGDTKKPGRKRGRPARNQSSTATTAASTNDNIEDEDNVEWVQCDKCEKWRKLPPHISADELPDIWNCSMNTWNPLSASCDAAEDKTDAHHQEVGASEWQLRQTHAGKYSYRQMIFGTGARKHNRPMSERARAAESLFVMPVTSDDESPHPTTQYTKSSAFLPRVSNFQKSIGVEENTIGIFDVLSNSNLWEDLRRMDPIPTKILSLSNAPPPSLLGAQSTNAALGMELSVENLAPTRWKTYESLSNEVRHAMQDVILQTLEFGCLTADEVITKLQWFPYKTSPKGVPGGIKGYCTPNIVVHTLLDLVRDGLVEMATVQDPYLPMSEWIPRYRRVGTRRAIEAVEAIKASRCMKIAKPWKQRTPNDDTPKVDWVTGEVAKVS